MPAAEVTIQRLEGFSSEDLESVVDSSSIEHVQAEPGTFRGRLLRARVDGRVLDAGAYNLPLLARGEMPGDRITLAFVRFPGGVLNGVRLEGPMPVLFTEGQELEARSTPEARWIGVQVERDELAALGVRCPGRVGGPLRCDDAALARLERELAGALAGLAEVASEGAAGVGAELRIGSLLEDAVAAFASALSPDARRASPGEPEGRRRLVREVQDLLDARPAEPLRVVELCQRTGVSYKTLERAFTSQLGVTPRRYAMLLRLARARRRLQAGGDETVTEVAMECGCHHLGRFSVEYRALFGESPSETLARHRGSRAVLSVG